MTEATEKQIKFAKTLGITEPEQYSKETLRELIDKKVGKAESKPEETEKTQPQAFKREYHLTPEQVRTNALNSAITCWPMIFTTKPTPDELIKLAKILEEYLNGN